VRNDESNIWHALWACDIFNSAPERFSEKASAIAKLIVAAMEKITDYQQLESLDEALGALGERLPAAQAKTGANLIVAAMEKTTEYQQLKSLGKVLGTLGGRLPAAQAETVAKSIVAAMEKTTDYRPLRSLGESLENFQSVKTVDYSAAIKLLKHLLVIGEIRQSILQFVRRVDGRNFENLQEFVEWVQKNHKDLDWSSPPQNPFYIN
jgi:hypothetical protein